MGMRLRVEKEKVGERFVKVVVGRRPDKLGRRLASKLAGVEWRVLVLSNLRLLLQYIRLYPARTASFPSQCILQSSAADHGYSTTWLPRARPSLPFWRH